MAKLDKKWTTLVCVMTLVFLSAEIVILIFRPHIKSLEADIRRESKLLEEEQVLLARKPSLEKEWEEKKSFFSSGLEPEAALNIWVKDLLSSAQSQSLALEKLEPAGIKTVPAGKKLTVFISFQGDIRKFVQFVYQLMDKDPLSQIESIDAKLDEGAKDLSFELMLGKIVK